MTEQELTVALYNSIKQLTHNVRDCPRDLGAGCPYQLNQDSGYQGEGECEPGGRDLQQVYACWVAALLPRCINTAEQTWKQMEAMADE